MLNFFLGMVILGGVASQSMMDAGMILIFLLFAKEFFQKKTEPYQFHWIGIEWAFAGYFLVAVISLYLNGFQPVPWVNYLTRFSWIPNLYLLVWAFNRIEFNFNKWFGFFTFAFVVPNIYAIISYFFGYDIITMNVIHGTVGLVNSATYHAHGNSLIFIFFVSLFLYQFENFKLLEKIVFALALMVMGFSIFLTFTRGIWGALFISLLILSFLRKPKVGFAFLVATAIFFTLAVTFSTTVHDRVLTSFSSKSDNIRYDLLHVHWKMFQTHPWFGIGYWDSYRQIASYWPMIGRPPDHLETHSHNQVINVLATTGLFGAFFFISIWIFLTKFGVRLYRKTKVVLQNHTLAVACLMVLIQFYLACLTDVTFEYAKIRGLVIAGVALMISLGMRNRETNE